MPIYEYSCQKCHARVEVMQKITDKPLKRCKSCGGKLEKEWSATSFQFKGSGWYVTDYAGKKTGDADKEPAAKTVSKAETKSDGAAETKVAAAETKSEPVAAEETKSKKTSRPTSTSKSSKSE